MCIISSIALLLAGLLLVSCSRTQPVAPHFEEKPVEQRVDDLEQYVNRNTPPLSDAEARKQREHDLAEIRSMGLVDRAQRDFSSRVTNAEVEAWTIGYFMHTNAIWCDVRYRLPGGSETLQQEFGYSRKGSTNWSLIWGVGAQPK
jgi:hypothetical protein